MPYVFEVIDKTGRSIYLTNERWKHIYSDHPDPIRELDNIIKTVIRPQIIIKDLEDPVVCYYHSFSKEKKKFLIVTIKYLNGKGFIITAYYKKERKL